MSSCDSYIPFLHNFITNKMEKYVNNPFLVRLLICDPIYHFYIILLLILLLLCTNYQLTYYLLLKKKKKKKYLNDYKDFFFLEK